MLKFFQVDVANQLFPDRVKWAVSSEIQGKNEGISGKRKKSEKSAFLGWTASEVPLINRAHALTRRKTTGKSAEKLISGRYLKT